jgi:hypothetical protein
VKKLVTGQLSLAMTFWGWGFCGAFLLGVLAKLGIRAGYAPAVPIVFMLKVALSVAVLSGLIFILRRKITVLASLAFLVVLLQVMLNIYMLTGLSSLLFK